MGRPRLIPAVLAPTRVHLPPTVRNQEAPTNVFWVLLHGLPWPAKVPFQKRTINLSQNGKHVKVFWSGHGDSLDARTGCGVDEGMAVGTALSYCVALGVSLSGGLCGGKRGVQSHVCFTNSLVTQQLFPLIATHDHR